ncbi:flagellar biosynthesis protein FlhF [Aliarcobacter butzleri]|mgnify:CR=1 FL=1|jgi:flagellar biosynthesis protein FlhF|uniref:Flagellar biosynthesis protein FlhF n=9 Tax=root TaxID=1 RepID=A8EW48_ALIB4|nr:flagellar biosynthesis protein FlhF [Aliarcobacter butzleri]MCP3650380.1 flagellar biosynthesis protein FlhF [Arcobacter sp. DNRA7]ABV68171.1 flagellar biosynthesis (GTP-binding) protein FlhF [Aliarcobacter butzleri RM4018]EFU70072.1 flagellar biosynthesis (GTP-binding) protein FlhF [Aliarcobacter butzleri JV22]KLD97037.1 flagellar biosynthesis protein FlhF [Aliarcobacter butzleri L349]KLE00747.1 flagellar biosynthesis regulator FlhF [Aliarcobacter butzleri L351]
MNKLSFLGETPTIALRKAQEECGEDAIVISTKKIANANGLNKDMYEIVVAIEDEETKKNLVYTKSAITKANENQEAIKAQVYDFKEEILKMQHLLEQVQKSIWNPKSQLFDLTIPPEFAPMYDIFEKNEFDQEMTYTIMKKTIKQLPISLKSNPNKINDFFKLILRRVIPIKHEVPLRPQQRKIIMMVGPTGVGKTTTISKLAARYAYKLGQNYKVGIVTLDSFRVGAVEQLQAYTNIMRLPLEVVKKPDDLAEALLRLKDCNYIFIDTAGSSQYDIDKIELINDYQKKVEELPIEKILVLPANVKHSDLLEIYKNYSILDIDYLTFTKLDETRSFGNLISFAHKTKKSITYFSIGQNVPDDLIVSDATYLIDCFMNQECARK